MSNPTPFSVTVSDADVAELRQRLAATRWPDPETPDDWSQGIPLAYVQDLAGYWANDYDMSRIATRLNRYDQLVTEISGVDIHVLHVPSPVPNALPVVMTHGWPGSVVEFLKVIDPLVDPEAHGGDTRDAFHVVCPTLPGYGFSGKPTTTGWGVGRIADAWAQLMPQLGYPAYVAQGGDWGSVVTTAIGIQDAEHCRGIHINMPVVTPDPGTMDDLTDVEKRALEKMQHYQDWDSGYSKQQATRPQTLGYGLADSPVGQMAWIVEKFWSWMDCDGHPENVLTRDELLDNVMMYWLTNSGASSARLYWESFGNLPDDPVNVPVGCSIFPKEIFSSSRRWAEQRFTNIVHWNELDRGGHFAAFEQPETFVDEVRTCFRAIR